MARGRLKEWTMILKHERTDRAYFLRRALEEHAAAAVAESPAAALAHLQLARQYERYAADFVGDGPKTPSLASTAA
jgi:hypothetical protein